MLHVSWSHYTCTCQTRLQVERIMKRNVASKLLENVAMFRYLRRMVTSESCITWYRALQIIVLSRLLPQPKTKVVQNCSVICFANLKHGLSTLKATFTLTSDGLQGLYMVNVDTKRQQFASYGFWVDHSYKNNCAERGGWPYTVSTGVVRSLGNFSICSKNFGTNLQVLGRGGCLLLSASTFDHLLSAD